MNKEVSWLLVVETKPGMKEGFHELIREMVTDTYAGEPGTIRYEYLTPDDGTTLHINERYRDTDAILEHLGNFGAKYAERFMSMIDVKRFDVYGPLSDQVREALHDFGATTHTSVAGFAR